MIVCGLDEAGRGPVIGSMVMAGVSVDEAGAEKLKNLGVKDSKLVTPKNREKLYPQIIEIAKKHEILIIEPTEIDKALNSKDSNLNSLEAQKIAVIINQLKPEKAIIDSPSPNLSAYEIYIRSFLKENIELVVEHKADLNHIECAAASILAKVTRDREIEALKKKIGVDFGSGYPSDPKTVAFLAANYKKYPKIFRKTWAPYKVLADKERQKTLDF